MITMDEKLCIVTNNPYMLSIYKDDSEYTLFRHAFKCWQERQASGESLPIRDQNPIFYSPFPDPELVSSSKFDTLEALGSKKLACPTVARIVLDRLLDELLDGAKSITLLYDAYYMNSYLRVLLLVNYEDEQLLDKVLRSGIGYYMARHLDVSDIFSEDFIVAIQICA